MQVSGATIDSGGPLDGGWFGWSVKSRERRGKRYWIRSCLLALVMVPWFSLQGFAGFIAAPAYATGNWATSVAVGDFNGDGFPNSPWWDGKIILRGVPHLGGNGLSRSPVGRRPHRLRPNQSGGNRAAAVFAGAFRARFSCERVCSGSGIPNLYDYLKDSGADAESPEVAARLAAAEDRTPLILQVGLDSQEPCPLCAATVRLFVSILGAEAGNLALKVLATGGVYLGGGIPPRILTALADGRFLEAFRRKGRLGEVLGRLPVHVITSRVALIGAASYRLGLAR
jgi:hypothetical protein